MWIFNGTKGVKQLLPTANIRNILRPVRRISLLILGLKGLNIMGLQIEPYPLTKA